MSSLFQSPLVLGITAFLGGSIVAYIIKLLNGATPADKAASSEHKIRALEADLRVTEKRFEETHVELTTARDELGTICEESEVLRKTLLKHDTDLGETKKLLQQECAKTAKLRRELTGRAEESARANAQIKDIETELDVIQAGSDVVAEQFQRLAAEREDLTGKLRTLGKDSAGIASDEPGEDMLSEDFMLDS